MVTEMCIRDRDMADNGIECSVVMEKASFDPRAVFPDFKPVSYTHLDVYKRQ